MSHLIWALHTLKTPDSWASRFSFKTENLYLALFSLSPTPALGVGVAVSSQAPEEPPLTRQKLGAVHPVDLWEERGWGHKSHPLSSAHNCQALPAFPGNLRTAHR